MASTGGTSKVITLTVDAALPARGQAASLAMGLLRKVRADTWDELTDKLTAGHEPTLTALSRIHLDTAQLELLAEHADVVRQVGVAAPRRTVALCDRCGQHVTLSSQPPSRCVMTLRCQGSYTKVGPAKAELVVAEELCAHQSGTSPQTPDDEPRPATPLDLGELDEDEEEFGFQ